MRGEHGVTAAVDESEHVVLGNFVAKSNATRAQNAALIIERNARTELHRLRLLHLVFKKAGTGPTILDAELLKLALARLVADRAIERMIDEQEFHYTFTTFLNHRRVCAHAHTFSDILCAADLRARHPVDDRFAVDTELRFACGTHPRHSHLDQTHPAIPRRAEFFVVPIARHTNPGLRASFDTA